MGNVFLLFIPLSTETPGFPRFCPNCPGGYRLFAKHDKLGMLLPTLERLAALEKACIAALPALFETCVVLQFEAGQLVLGAPNAALASKLSSNYPNCKIFYNNKDGRLTQSASKCKLGKSMKNQALPSKLHCQTGL